MTINVGIIGYGLSAKIFHIPFVTVVPEFKLYALVQRRPTADNDSEKDFPGVKSYRSVDDLVADPQVDLVVVTTTPDSHYALVKQALEAGKHVLVEKPFTPTSTEAYSLATLAASKSLTLTVYQNRRFDADFQTVQKLLNDSQLGRIAEFETHFDRHRPAAPVAQLESNYWKAVPGPGHGVAYDLGTHLIDQCVVLFGFPSRITATIYSNRAETPDFEDTATILLHYDRTSTRPTPLLCTVKATIISPAPSQLRYWIRGTDGAFQKHHLDIQEDQLKDGMRPEVDKSYGFEPKARYGVLHKFDSGSGKISTEVVPTVEPPTYAEFYRKLARTIKGDKKQIPVDPKVAAGVIRLVELARESSKLGKTLDVDVTI